MPVDFVGKTVAVTGAGSGIGRAVSEAVTRMGAKVVGIDYNKALLDKLVKEVKGCKAVVADLSNAADVQRAAEEAGDVDFLVNNAGINILEPFLETKFSSYKKVMAINTDAVFLLSQAIAKNMIKRGVQGAIVNMASQASKVGLVDHTSYCVSKGAVDQLTRIMALELGAHGIRVNAGTYFSLIV